MLFHAYRPVTARVDEAKIQGSHIQTLDYGTGRNRLDSYDIFNKIRTGEVNGVRVTTPEGTVTFSYCSSATNVLERDIFGADKLFQIAVDFGKPANGGDLPKEMAGIAVQKERSPDGRFYLSRDIVVDGRHVGYDVDVVYFGGVAVVSMRLPEATSKIDETVDGFAYRRLPREKRTALMKGDLEPIMHDSMGRGCGFFRRARRVDSRCITQFCTEPRIVNVAELERMFERSLEMDGETQIVYSDTITKGKYTKYPTTDWWTAVLAKPSHFMLTFNTTSHTSSKVFNDLFYERFGRSVPADSEVAFGERYTTLFGEGYKTAAAFLNRKEREWGVDQLFERLSPLNGIKRWRDERAARKREEDRRVAEWLERYAAQNSAEYPVNGATLSAAARRSGCILMVDGACELKVRRGEEIEQGERVTVVEDEPPKAGA